MKFIRIIVIVFVVLGIAVGCGPAMVQIRSYDAIAYRAYEIKGRKVFVGVDGTRTEREALPLYYSDIVKAPYHLIVEVHSHVGDTEALIVHSAVLERPDIANLILSSDSMGLQCRLDVAPWNDNFNACRISMPIGESLEFVEGMRFTVDVMFSFSDDDEIRHMNVTFVGVERTEYGTTFDVIMSV